VQYLDIQDPKNGGIGISLMAMCYRRTTEEIVTSIWTVLKAKSSLLVGTTEPEIYIIRDWCVDQSVSPIPR
jgi:hypothetical protein